MKPLTSRDEWTPEFQKHHEFPEFKILDTGGIQPVSTRKNLAQPHTRCRSSQSPLEEEPQSLPRTQEQPVTLGRRGPKSNQSPLEEEDPGATSHPQRKRIQEHPDTIGTRDLPCPPFKAEMGRRQCKSTYNNRKNKTSPESSPPPTPRPERCNVDKAEENDLKNSLMKMIEEAFEGKMKTAFKEIEEKTNEKLEEINEEIEEKNKKLEEMSNEIEEK
ncbi:hypothetical protein STEG23_036056 [Scotinomys teguina]